MKDQFRDFLRSKPYPSKGFKLMSEWESIQSSSLDFSAFELFKSGLSKEPLSDKILRNKSKEHLLAYLRYDFKKIMIRTRYLYVDRLFDKKKGILCDPPEGFGFFEPINNVFSFLEGLGGIRYPNDYLHKEPQRKYSILRKMLKRLGGGYKKYHQTLKDFHRNALAHELRPRKNWVYDYNTENKYLSPWVDSSSTHIDIPHFLDSTILELENICDDLCSKNGDRIVKQYIQYSNKLIKKLNEP